MFTENLALHQPAWQSTTGPWTSYTADLAVDGKYTNLDWTGGQCALSYLEQTTAEWRVDLGGIRNIHYMLIHLVGKSILGIIYFKIT